jgi:hypothetical protein
MKSVDIERRRARRFAVGFAFSSVIIGFVACGGSDEHKASPHNDYDGGGESAGGSAAAGAPTHGGGSQNLAGEANGGMSGGNAGGAISGGAAGDTNVGGDVGAGGDVGVGGDLGAGGMAGAGGQGFAGEAGNAGAAGQTSVVDPVCGVNMVQVGEYSLWCGRVNEHTDAEGLWHADADCTSGCDVVGVSYCQKFYPTATAVVAVPQAGLKDWKNAGFISGSAGPCNDADASDYPGISGQAACCAPL